MSITKTVASVAVLKLVEDGRAALDAPVREYLPTFKVRDEEASRALTVRHLLTHTAGWEGQLATAERGDWTLSMFIDELADVPQLAPTGRVGAITTPASESLPGLSRSSPARSFTMRSASWCSRRCRSTGRSREPAMR